MHWLDSTRLDPSVTAIFSPRPTTEFFLNDIQRCHIPVPKSALLKLLPPNPNSSTKVQPAEGGASYLIEAIPEVIILQLRLVLRFHAPAHLPPRLANPRWTPPHRQRSQICRGLARPNTRTADVVRGAHRARQAPSKPRWVTRERGQGRCWRRSPQCRCHLFYYFTTSPPSDPPS